MIRTAIYQETDQQTAQRERAFTYHPPHSSQLARYVELRSSANMLSHIFNASCPPSRELSIAQTKLEEAVMWANAAIARNESPPTPSDG